MALTYYSTSESWKKPVFAEDTTETFTLKCRQNCKHFPADFAKFSVQVFTRKKTNNCFSKKILQFL